MTRLSETTVFLSCAHEDGARLAYTLRQALGTLDTQRIAGGASWTRAIEGAIDQADVVLALLTAGSYVSEICRAEQLRSPRSMPMGKRAVLLQAVGRQEQETGRTGS